MVVNQYNTSAKESSATLQSGSDCYSEIGGRSGSFAIYGEVNSFKVCTERKGGVESREKQALTGAKAIRRLARFVARA